SATVTGLLSPFSSASGRTSRSWTARHARAAERTAATAVARCRLRSLIENPPSPAERADHAGAVFACPPADDRGEFNNETYSIGISEVPVSSQTQTAASSAGRPDRY